MCGRLAVTLPHDAMAQMFAAMPANNLPPEVNYNLCPTDQIAVVTGGENSRNYVSMRWGFLPHWYKSQTDGPLLINARSETIAEKPAFREACRQRRCLIPATGWYEWNKDAEGRRLPWYFHPADDSPVVFAGIWQDWSAGDEVIPTCAIVTTAANEKLSAVHHRMPVTLTPGDWPKWLGEEGRGAARLMTAAPDDQFNFHRVSTDVNSNKAKGAQLILPL